tara:strand:- start:315 stop:938 length:624 start_codon:yes stop_codon:yes gene_type:complete
MTSREYILISAFFSFCIHATLIMFFYGYFKGSERIQILTSQPVEVVIFEEVISKTSQKKDYVKLQPDILKIVPEAPKLIEEQIKDFSSELFETNFEDLISEENSSQINTINQDLASQYYFLIKQKIESAWMEPKNIPDNLECHLKILVNSRGRILDISLQKSSGNLRFDNSALRAVRRVETFNFYKEMDQEIYENMFKNILFRFDPK